MVVRKVCCPQEVIFEQFQISLTTEPLLHHPCAFAQISTPDRRTVPTTGQAPDELRENFEGLFGEDFLRSCVPGFSVVASM